MAGIFLLGSAGSSFNGGKSQIGLFSLPSFGYPFLNMLLSGGAWANITDNTLADPSFFDRDGYPTSIAPGSGGYYTTFTVPSQTQRPGNYVLGWKNTCTPRYNYPHTSVTYAITAAVSSGVTTILTLPSINPTSPNKNVLVVGQTISISGCASPFTTMNSTWDVTSVNVGGDPTKVAINFDSSALGAFVATGSPTVSNTTGNLGRSVSNGRYVFSTTVTTFSGGFLATGSPYATGMYFCHVDDEDLLLAGNMFSPKLKAIVATAKWGVARDLDIGMTSAKVAFWSHRKSATYLLQSASEQRATLFCGATTNVGQDFSINGNSNQTFNGLAGDIPIVGGPTDKMVMHLRFSGAGGTISSQTCSVPLNSAGSPVTINFASPHGFTNGQIVIFPTNNIAAGLFGNVPYYVIVVDANNIQVTLTSGGTGIATRGGGTLSQPIQSVCTLSLNGSPPAAIMSSLNFSTLSTIPKLTDGGGNPLLATMIYDAQLNAWAFDTGSNGAMRNGWAPEVFIRFCAECGMHPHIVAGQFAVDPMTDYIPNYATYIRNTHPWMIPRFEGCNELGLFSNVQTGYAWAKSYIDFDGNQFDSDNWYGKIISTIGQAVATVYGVGNKGVQYEVLAGFLGSFNDNLTNTNSHQTKVTSANYLAQAAPAQSGYTKSAAYNWVSSMCTAQYWNPGDWGHNVELTKAWALMLAKNAGNTATRDSIAQGYLLSGTFGGDLTITASNPTLTLANHGFVNGQIVRFATTGVLPSGIIQSTNYFVISSGLTTNTFQISATINGTVITPGAGQSGIHAVGYGDFCLPLELMFYRNLSILGSSQPVPIVKMMGYEGGYSPDGSSIQSNGALTGATVSAPAGRCVLTISTSNITGKGARPNDVFPAAVVGMPITVSNSVGGMVQLANATITSATTFSGSTVTWTQTFSADQAVFFSGTTMPTGINALLPYYVLAAGLTGSSFQISATKGGSPITFGGSPSNVTGHAGWVVTAIGGALGNNTKVEIDCDSSGFTPYTSGGSITYADGCAGIIGDLRVAGKGGIYASVPQAATVTLANYANWNAAGGTFPSHYGLAGALADWFLFDPDVYTATPSPQYDGIVTYNN